MQDRFTPYRSGSDEVSAPVDLNTAQPVQGFAFGGIANPAQRTFLRAGDKEFLDARKKELDAFEQQRLAYNEALTKWQNEVYNPYKSQVDAYNAAAQKYNTDVYEPYMAQYRAYEQAYNAGGNPTAPTLASEFTMAKPTLASEFTMAAPALPFKEEEVAQYQKEAAARARSDAENRAAAIDVVSNPDRFNFGSMSVANRFMAEGGSVEKDDQGQARKMMDDLSAPQDNMAIRSMVGDVMRNGQMSKDQVFEAVDRVAKAGRGGDELLAYLSPESMAMLKKMGGAGTINPATGLPEFKEILSAVVRGIKPNDPWGVIKEEPPAAATTPAAPAPAATKPIPNVAVAVPTIGSTPSAAQMMQQMDYRPNMPEGILRALSRTEVTPAPAPAPAQAAPRISASQQVPEMPADYLRQSRSPFQRIYRQLQKEQGSTPAEPTTPTTPTIPVVPPATPVQPPAPVAPGIGGIPVTPMPTPAVPTFGGPRPTAQPGMLPGTIRTPYNPLAQYQGPSPTEALLYNSNLAPGMIGGPQNMGMMTDRLGNRIFAPATPAVGFAKGGGVDVAALLAQNSETLSDEAPEETINTDPVGTAQQYMQALFNARQGSPVQQSIKRVRPSSGGGAKADKSMSMDYESLAQGEMGGKAPKVRDTDSAKAQLEELARQYQLKINAAKNKARGLSADTFGAPTLEGATLTKASLAKKRFAKGGEAKKAEAEESTPSLFGVSSYATRAAERMFPGQMGQDDSRDAARHMLAAAMVARKTSPGVAEFLGKVHERTSNPESFFSMLGIGKPRSDYEMDVHNNRLGAELAARTKSQAELEELVRQMALQAQTKQSPGKPWIMSREQMQERERQGMTPPPEYAHGGAVHRADGSPKEGEISDAEREAASRPAFVTPKSGKGRKRGPISDAINSGEALTSMAKGVTELPYDIAGAPVDIATLLMRPLGYNVEQPVMGSDWIKEKMTSAGVRPEPPADPTQRGFFTAGEMMSNLVNPAGVTRAGVRGAQKVGQAATEAAKDFQQYNRQLTVPGASYVSRAPGGYFPTSRIEGGILSNLDKALDPVLKKVREIEDPVQREALTTLFNQKAKDFYTKQAGSIQDPLRADILSGAMKFDDEAPLGDVFPRTLQKSAAQGDLQALRLLEKAYDEMIGIRSVVPRRQGTDEVQGVPVAQIMANMQANLDKIPDAQLLAYAGKKPGQGPNGVAEAASQVREKLRANPTLFSTVLEPRIARTLFVQSKNATDTDIARYPTLYGTPATEAMVTPGVPGPGIGEPTPPGYFFPEVETAIEKGQPIQDIDRTRISLLGMDTEKMLNLARQMPPEELNQMGFADFLKKAYASTQEVDKYEAAIPKVKGMIQAGRIPPAPVMTYGMRDYLPTSNDFRWVKVVNPEGVRSIAAGMDNSVASYARSTTYGSLNKGRAALDKGEAEIYALYDKNNIPHVTVEYLTAKPGVPDNKKNTIAQLTGNGPLTANATPEKYAPQIVDLLNNLRPNSVPPGIKKLLQDTGQKEFLSEDVLAPIYFGVPLEALRPPR